MKSMAMASHYSKALFQLFKSKDVLEKRLVELEWINGLMQEVPEFQRLILQPFVKVEEKKKVLQRLLQGQVDDSLLHLLFLLLDKKRIEFLPQIIKGFRELANEELSILRTTVITAVPIEEELKEKIKRTLEKSYQKTVQIKEKIDSTIVGGMILMMGNRMFDDSIKSRLNQLKVNLLAAK